MDVTFMLSVVINVIVFQYLLVNEKLYAFGQQCVGAATKTNI